MQIPTLLNKQIAALEFQTNILYESFKRAVETQNLEDAVWNSAIFSAFGNSLHYAVNFSPFMEFPRNSDGANALDKYIVYYLIGDVSSGLLK